MIHSGQEANVPRQAVRKPGCTLSPVLLTTAVLLVTACGGRISPVSPESPTAAVEEAPPIDYSLLDDVLHSQQAQALCGKAPPDFAWDKLGAAHQIRAHLS